MVIKDTNIMEINEVLNEGNKCLLLKSRIVPAGISRKTGKPTVDVFIVGNIRPVGTAFPIFKKGESGIETSEIIGYKLDLKGCVKNASVYTIKEVKTPLFNQTFKIAERYSEKKGKNYFAVLDDNDNIVGFAHNYYMDMSYTYSITVLKK